jgi:hypothetical protein
MAGPYVSGSSSAFPQTSANRTRAVASSELAQYVGGENRGDSLLRCGQAWDAAVRSFNSVPWKFNRVVADILIDSTMPDATTPPSISRDGGAGVGFTLTSGVTISYWVQERVKSGSTILKRNFSPASSVVTLVGDGTNDKPVLTRPTTRGADTTHWALFGTAAGQAYPNGAELAEVAIATTTIEDTRSGNDPLLPSAPTLYEYADFDIPSDFRNPRRAWWLDAAGVEQGRVEFVEWEGDFTTFDWPGTGASPALAYTFRNSFGTGKGMIFPRVRLPQTYPSVRLLYNKRIALASGDGDFLLVPSEVDQAIFDQAVGIIISRVRSFVEAGPAFSLAARERDEVEQEWRDHADRERW